MATVGITKELRDRTKAVIDVMRTAERRNDIPEMLKDITVDASHLYNLGMWGAHIHLINQIPKDWLLKATDENIFLVGDDENGARINTVARFTGMKDAYQRPTNSYYSRIQSTLTIDQLRAMPEETVGRTELLKRWDDAIIAIAIDARWEKIKVEVDQFLTKCKSLNEAVKLFPGVRMYIDRDDIERLERKLERPSQRKAIVHGVDTDGLTAAAIAAKLSAAS
jgi:hypothetical protein